MIREKAIFLLTLVMIVLTPRILIGAEVTLPSVNLGGTAFLDGVAGPGLMFKERIQYYHATDFKNSKGDTMPGNNSISSWGGLTQVSCLTKLKILGGYYGGEALLPAVKLDVHTDFGPRGHKEGLGDLILSPFQLQWVDHKILGMSYFHRLNFTFIVPTGKYDEKSKVNIGNNLYSIDPYYAFTLIITPKLETSCRFQYLWNSINHDPPKVLNAGNTQPGQAFHMNYAISYEVFDRLRAGMSGYFLEQTTADKVDGVKRDHSKEQVFAIGPGLLYSKNKLYLYLSASFESSVQNRQEGERITFYFMKVF
jgi:hypothetical protein